MLQPLVARMVDKRVLYTRDPMALKAWSVIQVRRDLDTCRVQRVGSLRGIAERGGGRGWYEGKGGLSAVLTVPFRSQAQVSMERVQCLKSHR